METKRTSHACCIAPHVLPQPQLLPVCLHACGGRSGDSDNNLWNSGLFLRRTFIRCILGDILCGCYSGSCAVRAARSLIRTTQQCCARGCATPRSRCVCLRMWRNGVKPRWYRLNPPHPYTSLTLRTCEMWATPRRGNISASSQRGARGAEVLGKQRTATLNGGKPRPADRLLALHRLPHRGTTPPTSRPAPLRGALGSACLVQCGPFRRAVPFAPARRAASGVCVFAGGRGAEPGPWRTAARSGPMAASWKWRWIIARRWTSGCPSARGWRRCGEGKGGRCGWAESWHRAGWARAERGESGGRAAGRGGRAGGCGMPDREEVAAPHRSAARRAPPCCCPASGWRATHGSRVAQLCVTRKATGPRPRAGLCWVTAVRGRSVPVWGSWALSMGLALRFLCAPCFAV